MNTIKLVVIGASAMLATPAVSQGQPPAKAPDSRDANAAICKRDRATGTRFQTKTCRTKAQWDALAEEQKRNYSEMRDRPVIEIRKDT